MSTVASTYVQDTRPARVEALMWVAERAHLLADAYVVTVGNTFDAAGGDVGDVRLQGEAGALRALVARFEATPRLDRTDDNYREWVAFDEGVRVVLIEERDAR